MASEYDWLVQEAKALGALLSQPGWSDEGRGMLVSRWKELIEGSPELQRLIPPEGVALSVQSPAAPAEPEVPREVQLWQQLREAAPVIAREGMMTPAGPAAAPYAREKLIESRFADLPGSAAPSFEDRPGPFIPPEAREAMSDVTAYTPLERLRDQQMQEYRKELLDWKTEQFARTTREHTRPAPTRPTPPGFTDLNITEMFQEVGGSAQEWALERLLALAADKPLPTSFDLHRTPDEQVQRSQLGTAYDAGTAEWFAGGLEGTANLALDPLVRDTKSAAKLSENLLNFGGFTQGADRIPIQALKDWQFPVELQKAMARVRATGWPETESEAAEWGSVVNAIESSYGPLTAEERLRLIGWAGGDPLTAGGLLARSILSRDPALAERWQRNGFVERSDLEPFIQQAPRSSEEAIQQRQMGAVGYEAMPGTDLPIHARGQGTGGLAGPLEQLLMTKVPDLALDTRVGSQDINPLKHPGDSGGLVSALGQGLATADKFAVTGMLAAPMGGLASAAAASLTAVPSEVNSGIREGVGGEIRDGRIFTATDEQLERGEPMGVLSAMTEGLPLGHAGSMALKSFTKKGLTQGLRRLGVAAGVEAMEEGAQEWTQAQIQDFSARFVSAWDPERGFSMHPDEVIAGALTGMGMAGAQGSVPAGQQTINALWEEISRQTEAKTEQAQQRWETRQDFPGGPATETPQTEPTTPEAAPAEAQEQPAPAGEPAEAQEPTEPPPPGEPPQATPQAEEEQQAPPEEQPLSPEEREGRDKRIKQTARSLDPRVVDPPGDDIQRRADDLVARQATQQEVQSEYESIRENFGEEAAESFRSRFGEVAESTKPMEVRQQERARAVRSLPDEAKSELVKLIDKWTGGRATVVFREFIGATEGDISAHGEQAAGTRELGGRQFGTVIELSMAPRSGGQFVWDAAHESLHFILRNFATPQQEKLVRTAFEEVSKKEGKGRDWEEVAADVLGAMAAGEMTPKQAIAFVTGDQALTLKSRNAITLFLDRLRRMFVQIRNVLTRSGYKTAEEFLEAVESGRVAKQQAFKPEEGRGARAAQLRGVESLRPLSLYEEGGEWWVMDSDGYAVQGGDSGPFATEAQAAKGRAALVESGRGRMPRADDARRQRGRPYAGGQRPVGSLGAERPADAKSMLERISGSRDSFHALVANRLAESLGSDVGIQYQSAKEIEDDIGVAVGGHYDADTNTIVLREGGSSEALVLHELVHAATVRSINRVEEGRGSDKENKAYSKLQDIYIAANKAAQSSEDQRIRDLYGVTNMSEFAAEALSNREFQDFLGAVPSSNKQSLWTRFALAVLDMLGIDKGSILGDAISAIDGLMRAQDAASPLATPLNDRFREMSRSELHEAAREDQRVALGELTEEQLGARIELARRERRRLHDRWREGRATAYDRYALNLVRDEQRILEGEVKFRARVGKTRTAGEHVSISAEAAQERLKAVGKGKLDLTERTMLVVWMADKIIRGGKKPEVLKGVRESFGKDGWEAAQKEWNQAQALADATSKASPLRSRNQDFDVAFARARGIRRQNLVDKIRQYGRAIAGQTRSRPKLARNFTERTFFAPAHDILRNMQDVVEWGQMMAAKTMLASTDKLENGDLQGLAMILIARDMVREIESGKYTDEEGDPKPLPFFPDAISPADQHQQMRDILADLESQLAIPSNRRLREALATREHNRRELVSQLAEADLLREEVVDIDRYFHRMVLYYMDAKATEPDLMAEGSTPSNTKGGLAGTKGYQVGRRGSLKDFNTDYVQAELDWMSDAFTQLRVKALLGEMKSLYDKRSEFVEEAKRRNNEVFYRNLGLEAYEHIHGHRPKKKEVEERPELKAQVIELGRQRAEEVLQSESRAMTQALFDIGRDYAAGKIPSVPPEYKAMLRNLGLAAVDPSGLFAVPKGVIENKKFMEMVRWLHRFSVLSGSRADNPASEFQRALIERQRKKREMEGEDRVTLQQVIDEHNQSEGADYQYVEWSPDGSMRFFKAWTYPDSSLGAVMEELARFDSTLEDEINAALATAKSDLEASKKGVLAVGKRSGWVIPKQLADTLQTEEGQNRKHVDPAEGVGQFLLNGVEHFQRFFKRMALFRYMRFFKYRLVNQIGDTEMLWVGLGFRGLMQMPGAFTTLFREYLAESPSKSARRLAGILGVKPLNESEQEELAGIRSMGVLDSGFTGAEIKMDGDTARLVRRITQGEMTARAGDPRVLTTMLIPTHVKIGDKYRGIPLLRFARTWFDFALDQNLAWESMARLAAYREIKRKFDAGEENFYLASRPKDIDAIIRTRGKTAAAAKMARELLGDYGDISSAGQFMRTHVVPFWSWMEIQNKRYFRLIYNAARYEGTPASDARMKTVLQALNPRVAAIATMYGVGLVVRSLPLMLTVYFWNLWMLRDLDDEERKLVLDSLSDQQLIVGNKNERGQYPTVRTPGVTADILSWGAGEDIFQDFDEVMGVGLDDIFLAVMRVEKPELDFDKQALDDKVSEAIKAPFAKIVGGASPQTKLLYEMISGEKIDWAEPLGGPNEDWFPVQTRPIESRSRHFLSLFGQEDVYDRYIGGPVDPDKPPPAFVDPVGFAKDPWVRAEKEAERLLAYRIDPHRNAYFDARDHAMRYRKDVLGKSVDGSGQPTDKSKQRKALARAVRYYDQGSPEVEQAMGDFVDLYREEKVGPGKTRTLTDDEAKQKAAQSIEASTRIQHPLYGIDVKTEPERLVEYMGSLSKQEKYRLEVAIRYWEENINVNPLESYLPSGDTGSGRPKRPERPSRPSRPGRR